jgi:hypothetical protein
MKFIADCPECQCLWHAYSAATTAHIKLEGKLRIAALSHNEASVIALTPEVDAAALDRSAARTAIRTTRQLRTRVERRCKRLGLEQTKLPFALLGRRYLLFFAAAQRLRCASAIRALPSGEMRRFFRATGALLVPEAMFAEAEPPSRFRTSAMAAVMRPSSCSYPSNAARSRDSSCRAISYQSTRR